jgi:large subunit ribosomal protein L11
MAKKVTKKVKVMAMGGGATPAPPLGPALGQAGVNIGEFVKRFNDVTKDRKGEVVPVVISVYEDRTFDFITKTSPASALVLKAIKIEKGSGKPNTMKVGKITKAQIKEIAEKKMNDLNATSIEGAMKIIEGTCRSMGVEVK